MNQLINGTHDRMNTWERINRMRLQYEKRHTVNIERSLRWQIEPVLDALKDTDPDELISKIDTLIGPETIGVGFNKLYSNTGKDFAGETFTQINGKALKSDMDDIWMQEMIAFAEMKTGKRIASITQTSKDRAIKILRKIMQEMVIPEGLSIFETRELIFQAFTSQYIGVEKPYTITGRARVIAQTEVLTASNYGSQMGAESAGATRKTWLTSGIVLPDQEPRHVGYPGLHMQKRAFNDSYDVRGYSGMYPGDPGLPASESVNCHCAETYERE